MILTSQTLHAASTQGFHGFTRAQLDVLGIPWPGPKHWLKKLIGTEISDEKYAAFKAAGSVNAKQFRRLKREPHAHAPAQESPRRKFIVQLRNASACYDAGEHHAAIDHLRAAMEIVGADAKPGH